MTRFVLLLGHGGAEIQRFATTLPAEWDVRCVDTGLDTPTGGRLARAHEHLEEATFCLTYADGLADVNLQELISFHRSHGGKATVTVVRPHSPWGVARLADDGRVATFAEKPRLESWINGGFFVLEPAVLEVMAPDDVLEETPLEKLAAAGELHAFRHEGFWDCMDTYKDTLVLNRLWDRGEAPWHPRVRA